jgi:trehalose 6-phosphate synthase
MNGYYHGYANRLLWPLCHLLPGKVYLKEFYWQSYKKVNALFADAIIEEAPKKGGFVWLQDFHLALCAAYIRKSRPDLRLSIFWHIPWPPYDVFRAAPQRRELLEGMLANDLVGFQIDGYKRNFLRCVDLELGAGIDVKGGFIHWKGHTTKVKAFPISVDFKWFDEAARSVKAVRYLNKFKRERNLNGKIIGISVDRLDYTKGIVKCFEALEIFFEKYPEYRERFTFVQIAIPTRKTEPYMSYMREVKKKVTDINDLYATKDWRPIEYIEQCCSHHELAALFRGADMMVITSVFDGMNLVAKEYVASQVDCTGTLLVSEFAGVAEGLPGVVVINPYDTEGCADMIRATIEAAPEKKKELMTIARDYLAEHDIYRWVDNILREMRNIR